MHEAYDPDDWSEETLTEKIDDLDKNEPWEEFTKDWEFTNVVED